MLQNKQRVHHRQGQQAVGDTTEGQGYQAYHRRGEGQETAVEAVEAMTCARSTEAAVTVK